MYPRFLTEIVVLEHQKWHSEPLDLKFSAFKTVSLRKIFPDLKTSGGWTVCHPNSQSAYT